MSEERIDFSPLDPTRDPERFEEVVSAISLRAAAELAARRAGAGVFEQISRWWRPMLAAAAVTGIISIGTLTQIDASEAQTTNDPSFSMALGVPEQLAQWVESDELPTTAELLLSLEVGE